MYTINNLEKITKILRNISITALCTIIYFGYNFLNLKSESMCIFLGDHST
jgi:hypothetical protein